MTDQPELNRDQKAQAHEQSGAEGEPVIRDKRRVKAPSTGGGKATAPPPAAGSAAAEPATARKAAADAAHAVDPVGTTAAAAATEETPTEPAQGAGAPPGDQPEEASPEPATSEEAEPEPTVSGVQAPGGFVAELEAARAELDERTRDLQRLSAEYANYRKRVERDRALIGEQSTANVLSALLPVLDDLDRARDHDELPEGVSAVVDQLVAITRKFGLTPFGEQGDQFDPNRHEAVAHQTSSDVSEPTCVDILRRGYLLGDRLLRPAMVAVADPE